jgi:hypothetical protein
LGNQLRNKNIQFVKELHRSLDDLKNKRSEEMGGEKQLNNLMNYLTNFPSETNLTKLKTEIEKQIQMLKSILGSLDKTSCKTKEEFSSFYEEKTKSGKLNHDIELYEMQLSTLLEQFDICPTCLGDQTFYDYRAASGDPNAKSWEYQTNCRTCKGTGQFSK